tara:strand:+ start:387 stop:794 length:408 start_codon:yes stop_codon:yes gene_type:complete
MQRIPTYLSFEIIKFIPARWFVNYLCINKKTLIDVKTYLKFKKNTYKYSKIPKTYKNSLYKLYKTRSRRNLTIDYLVSPRIIKIVDVKITEGRHTKYKIIFWVLCSLGKVGNVFVSYPDWCIVDKIKQEHLIPFY